LRLEGPARKGEARHGALHISQPAKSSHCSRVPAPSRRSPVRRSKIGKRRAPFRLASTRRPAWSSLPSDPRSSLPPPSRYKGQRRRWRTGAEVSRPQVWIALRLWAMSTSSSTNPRASTTRAALRPCPRRRMSERRPDYRQGRPRRSSTSRVVYPELVNSRRLSCPRRSAPSLIRWHGRWYNTPQAALNISFVAWRGDNVGQQKVITPCQSGQRFPDDWRPDRPRLDDVAPTD